MKLSMLLLPVFFLPLAATAAPVPPPMTCTQRTGEPIAINNEQVLELKKKSATEFVRSRAHIQGSVVRVLVDSTKLEIEKETDQYRKKHQRFMVQIGPAKEDLIEVFYNGRYAPRPALKKGDKLEACGEFVADSTADASQPFAIVYWVHAARAFPHVEGYVAAKGRTFGRDVSH